MALKGTRLHCFTAALFHGCSRSVSLDAWEPDSCLFEICFPVSITSHCVILTIYAPMIYTAPSVVILIRASIVRGGVLELETSVGPVK